MNSCNFLGRLYGDVYHDKSNNVSVVNFKLEIENFRKNKNGVKTRSVSILNFEAWHTAAITINDKLTREDLILVECSARNTEDSTVPVCYFRVNSFKIFKKDKYSQKLED